MTSATLYLVRVKQLILLTFRLGSGAPPGLGEVSLPTLGNQGGALHRGELGSTAVEVTQAHRVPLEDKALVGYADQRNPMDYGTTVGGLALVTSAATSSVTQKLLEFDASNYPEPSCTAPQVMT